MSKTEKPNQNNQTDEQTKKHDEIKCEQTCNDKTAGPETNEKADDLAQLNDRYLRLCAEYDNFKKRTDREKSEIYTCAAADIIETLLPVMDTIIRATEMDGCNEGIALIKKQLDTVLTSIGVEQIKAIGEQFNPHLHEAVMHIEDDTVGNNTVVEVLAAGYKYKEKVIRHSMVNVAN